MAKMSLVYSEVYSFINALGNEYKNRIPKEIFKTIEEQRDKGYTPVFHADQKLKDGQLSEMSLALVSMLNLSYWCSDNLKKKELLQAYMKNDKK